MRRPALLLPWLLMSSTLASQSPPVPPVAEVRPKVDTLHGQVRSDPYAWMRDRADPAVTAYLEAENRYTREVMRHTEELQERLYQEMRARIKETDLTVPERIDGWLYYDRTEGVRLQAKAPVRWVGSQYLLPEWSEPVPDAWNFSEPQLLSPLAEMDGCFGQFGGHARLEWPEKGAALDIAADPIFGVMIVYVPQRQDFFCLETVSNVNDAFNLESRGVAGNGTLVLEPGQSARGSIVYTPSAL